MQRKIQKLQEELEKKDKIFQELQEQKESMPQDDITDSQTNQPKQRGAQDETESESEYGCDSVKVSSKPSKLNLQEAIQVQKQQSLTPQHQPEKAFKQQSDKKLVVQIDAMNEQSINCIVSHDSQSPKNDKPEEKSE